MSIFIKVEDIYWHDSIINEILYFSEKREVHLSCEFNRNHNLGVESSTPEIVEALVFFIGVENIHLTEEIYLFSKNNALYAEVLKVSFTNNDDTRIKSCDIFLIIDNYTQTPPLTSYGSLTFKAQ